MTIFVILSISLMWTYLVERFDVDKRLSLTIYITLGSRAKLKLIEKIWRQNWRKIVFGRNGNLGQSLRTIMRLLPNLYYSYSSASRINAYTLLLKLWKQPLLHWKWILTCSAEKRIHIMLNLLIVMKSIWLSKFISIKIKIQPSLV